MTEKNQGQIYFGTENSINTQKVHRGDLMRLLADRAAHAALTVSQAQGLIAFVFGRAGI